MLHEQPYSNAIDQIQRIITRVIAENPAGRGLCLIGGYRFRLLDQSPRLSADIDYHWSGDLDEKAKALTSLFERRLLPEVKRILGYDGSVSTGMGPGDESPAVRIIEVAFYNLASPEPRIEIPVEITSILCSDPPGVRTLPGTVYLTVSDQDMIESKVIALLNRTYVQERDFLDLFLFQSNLASDSKRRLATKLNALHITGDDIAERMIKFQSDRGYHIRNIEAIMHSQLEPEAAERLFSGGGGAAVFDQAMKILEQNLHFGKGKST
jgi:hypothetical protein